MFKFSNLNNIHLTARALTKTQPAILVKKLLKLYVTALLKTLSEPDPIVRDAAADALGTAMKLVGEKAIAPYLTEVDALKMEKIKEYHEKAVITVKVAGVKKERPQSGKGDVVLLFFYYLFTFYYANISLRFIVFIPYKFIYGNLII